MTQISVLTFKEFYYNMMVIIQSAFFFNYSDIANIDFSWLYTQYSHL